MNSRVCVLLRAVAAVCVLTMLATRTTSAASEREIQGTYKVADTTEAGDQVQVKIQVRLMNRTGERLSIQNLRFPAIGQSNSSGITPPVEIAAYDHAKVTMNITLSHVEYAQLQKGVGLKLSATFQGANGQLKNRVIELMRLDGMGAE
jgi:hypothetical protein